MVNYNCSICNYITIRKTDYNRHIDTKKHLLKNKNTSKYLQNKKVLPYKETPITSKTDKSVKNIKINECKYCFKTFTRIDSLNRHNQKYCKFNKIEAAQPPENKYTKEKEYNKLEKDKLYGYIEKLKNKIGKTNIIINNQMNNKINLNNFENPELSEDYIWDKLYTPHKNISSNIENIRHFNHKRKNVFRIIRKMKWKLQYSFYENC